MTKSIEIEYYFQVGIFESLSSPTRRWYSALTFWQVRYLSTCSAISLFKLFHQKYYLRFPYILVLRGYAEYRVLWASSKICILSLYCWVQISDSEIARFLLHVWEIHKNFALFFEVQGQVLDLLEFFLLWSTIRSILTVIYLLAHVTPVEHPSSQALSVDSTK